MCIYIYMYGCKYIYINRCVCIYIYIYKLDEVSNPTPNPLLTLWVSEGLTRA